MTAKIFVRERRKIQKGEKRPRYRVLGVSGGDLKVYAKHVRKKELEGLSKATGAEVIYLKAGKQEKEA